MVIYFGGWRVETTKSSSYTLGAILLAPSLSCMSGQPVTFSLDRDPVTGLLVNTPLGTATTNRYGLALLTVPTSQWQAGKYTLSVAFAGNNMGCLPSSSSATITVAAAGRNRARYCILDAGLALAAPGLPVAIAPSRVGL
ncbi:MAG: hypothetical protein ABSB75_02580 [Candidatus Limnocylindrales bacterium]